LEKLKITGAPQGDPSHPAEATGLYCRASQMDQLFSENRGFFKAMDLTILCFFHPWFF
jgi:hypothetical protein